MNYKETVVVSASKTEQQLIDAPATMTVIGPAALAVAPSSNYADLLRNVPGVNITQISARDVNVTSRGATSSLATSQLTVVDGRSVYQDFFGFTMWDFVPSNARRDQADRSDPRAGVGRSGAPTRSTASSTSSPSRRARWRARTVTFGVGGFDREVADNGELPARSSTCAARTRSRQRSVGVQDLGRASTRRTRSRGRSATSRTAATPDAVSAVRESGHASSRSSTCAWTTTSPTARRSCQFSGGIGGTDGIMHTGIGPFDIDGGATMGYGKVDVHAGTPSSCRRS